MEKIVLIFGTFNPITNAHIQMGVLAKKQLPDSRIIYIPSKNRFLSSWKMMDKRSIMDGDVRICLMEEALATYGFEVCDIEVATDISGKTYDTIEAVKEIYGTDEIYICMGTDKVGELHIWYKGEQLISENRYLIISRDGCELDTETYAIKKYPDRFTLIPNDDYCSVSSTEIREAYISKNLDSVRDSIPDTVYEYLKTHEGVYQ